MERVYSGQGLQRESGKVWLWAQDGKRTFDGDNNLDGNTTTVAGDGTNGKGQGGYLEGGWRVLKTPWQLDARYDVLTLLKDNPAELRYKSYTLGAQYFFTPTVRFMLSAMHRDGQATKFDHGTSFNAHLDGVDRKYAAQVSVVF